MWSTRTHQYIKDYKVGICRGEDQQWEGRQSTVRWLTINTVDCWSWGGGSTVNSERVDGQWSTVRQLMINTVVDPGGRINSQQWDSWWSMVNSEVIDDQHCWLLIWGDQQSIQRGWCIMGNALSSTSKVEVHRFAEHVWNLGYINVLNGRGQVSVHLFSPNLALLSNVLMGRCR